MSGGEWGSRGVRHGECYCLSVLPEEVPGCVRPWGSLQRTPAWPGCQRPTGTSGPAACCMWGPLTATAQELVPPSESWGGATAGWRVELLFAGKSIMTPAWVPRSVRHLPSKRRIWGGDTEWSKIVDLRNTKKRCSGGRSTQREKTHERENTDFSRVEEAKSPYPMWWCRWPQDGCATHLPWQNCFCRFPQTAPAWRLPGKDEAVVRVLSEGRDLNLWSPSSSYYSCLFLLKLLLQPPVGTGSCVHKGAMPCLGLVTITSLIHVGFINSQEFRCPPLHCPLLHPPAPPPYACVWFWV